MIVLHDREACTGCSACAMICPVQSIQMTEDAEGFLYPAIEEDTCIHCGRCEKACPVSNPVEEVRFRQDGYVLQNRDEEVRRESTSGGAFSAIAGWILDRGGVVFGAAFREDFSVAHTWVQSREELEKFRNSKYVQSDPGQSFREAEGFLRQGRWVCYSGTPCQIEGLKAFLGKEYKKLVTVDIVCHGIPSPLVWRRYLEMQHKKLGSFSRIRFRDKHHGYKYSALSIFNAGGQKIYARGIDTDQMTRAFFSDLCDRPSCYRCIFKKRYRVSDFTLWDCFDVFLYDRKLDDDRGASSVLIHTDRGRRIFAGIQDRVHVTPVDPDVLTSHTREMFFSVRRNPGREKFLRDAAVLPAEELFDRYFPENAKVRCARFLRVSMCRLGIYGPAKRLVTRVKRIGRKVPEKK
ncbi:MAG: Coenzyme F420 hydrogenase/dehydrogenase, beta subunit C-terminal domain [Eubacteriales bacterium]|nr:Coenzyme F420 hydrogenase/dehydrogenase, beta subunit C-terminal domain [Eubacteriales bacterium]